MEINLPWEPLGMKSSDIICIFKGVKRIGYFPLLLENDSPSLPLSYKSAFLKVLNMILLDRLSLQKQRET